jgi:hypothetical protein
MITSQNLAPQDGYNILIPEWLQKRRLMWVQIAAIANDTLVGGGGGGGVGAGLK